MRRLLSAAALFALLALAPASLADPTGRSTVSQTVAPGPGTGYVPLTAGPGEPYVVRRGGSAKASGKRAGRRRSIAFFAQLTDPQIADEMSPARVDFVDPAGGALKSAHRPQEALGPQTFDAIVRNVNANRRSAVKDGRGRRAALDFAITTGDLADNQQLNETRWFRTVLDGGRVDPFSGKPVGAANPCPGAAADVVARLDADVAARRYTGLQDYDDWRGARDDLYGGYWDPDEAALHRRPVRRVPPPPRADGPRAGAVRRGGPRCPVVHLARQPRRPRPGQRGRQHGPVPRDRRRMPQGLPDARGRPGAVRGRRRERAVPPLQRPGVHLLAARGRPDRPAGPGPPDRVQAGVPRADARGRPRGARLRDHEREGAQALQGHGELLRDEPGARAADDLARHGRRGRRAERQPRRPAVPLAQARAAQGAQARPARGPVRPPHAGDAEQRDRRRGGRGVRAGGRTRAATPIRASRPRCTSAPPASARSGRCSRRTAT